jgi:Tol biopolymer transport system component
VSQIIGTRWIVCWSLIHAYAHVGISEEPISETRWLTNVRQITFEGRRAGEGYFSADGSLMVFQSERDATNPFFQIFLMDRETGDIASVSPGTGKTTCAWIHPNNQQVLFASTHGDPDAVAKQKAEIELRASGKERRYAWDYDPSFDLYSFDRRSKQYTQLTSTPGYDAEASYSPDGSLIAFASNRRGYTDDLSPSEREAFKLDPAVMNDIFIMDADGTNARQLTHTLGYDGGPFFSPDGTRLCWRRFAENGATAEIMTMKIDGTDQRQLTRLNAMSWAPYYHPSGKYLIFATNLHGFSNFELYIVDVGGRHEPVRVTTTEGFDGLPVFSPDGQQLAWTTNRTAAKQSQIFMADWNHDLAVTVLGIDQDPLDSVPPETSAQAAVAASEIAFSARDVMRHVDYLCRPQLAGRMTGSQGEQLATAYVAAMFDQLGLRPAGEDHQWFQTFEFTAGIDLGVGNKLTAGGAEYEVTKSWQPLAFSETGAVAAAPVVFAGYGIAAPQDGDHEEYDSFVHLDVKDKWILCFRFMPEQITPEQRQHLSRHSSLRFKAMIARDRGARGLIVVSGPNSNVKQQLVRLQFDGTLSGASVPVISITDDLAQTWLEPTVKNLHELQTQLDTGEPRMGFTVTGLKLAANIEIQKSKRTGRNVLGRLQAGDEPSDQAIIVGAHIDHLGTGASASSLARDDEKSEIHFGADDNASGIAAMLEVAQYLSDQQRRGELALKRDVIFAAWSGEELGLIGSSHYAKQLAEQLNHAAPHANVHREADEQESTHAPDAIYPAIAACLNMDMVGRFEKRLVLQGVGSSSIWKGEIEKRNAPIGLPITLQDDSYLPTDASTFFMRGVPILSAFTGSHTDYHTPRDTPDKLNYDAAAKISRFMGLVARSLAIRDAAPDYVSQEAPKQEGRARLRAYLGTIPDYAESDAKGLRLSGVARNGPSDQGGLQSGDLIVELAGKKIDNIYDYTYAIEALKIGQPVKIVVQRGEKRITLEVTPGSRD